MKIFHFDFNTAFFNREYLENFIRRLKEWGYDTLLWELEDFVRWDTLKYCFQSDSISKNEMAEILNFTEELGFSNIPLVQCLGHCEYVLSCKEYAHMADAPGKIAPYCPQNPQVQDFLKHLLKEYMELFSKSKYIHLGCDEVWGLGDDCPECQKVIAAGGKETLLAQHINFLNSFVRNNGREAMIWADMLLIHPHGVQMLDKNIIMVDWRYELRSDRNMLWLWDEKGGHLIDESEITEDMRRNFGRYLYKNGKLNIFYTVDFLLDSGFRVISAGASSSYPDNFILGQTVDHICNACSMMQKSCECMGYLHTSWTVHCFAYEFQPAIEMVRMTDDFEAVMDEYADRHFGISGERFFSLLKLLEGRMLFAYAGSTGHGKAQKEPPENIINIRLKDYEDAGLLESELERVYQFYDNYTRALSGLQNLRGELKRGHELFDNYIFAAETLKNRAEFVIFAISEYLQIPHSIDCNAVKEKLQKLSEKYYQDCRLRYTPAHAKRFVRIIFGTLVEYLNLQKILKNEELSIMKKTKIGLLLCITAILLGCGCSAGREEADYIAEIKKLNLQTDETQTMLVRSKKKQPADLIIPYGPKYIRKESFRAIPGIESVFMPDSVILIGDCVFADNRKLRKVRFSAKLKDIGKFTFFECPSLEEVILPPNLEKIGCSAFENCTSLKKIVIPETVTVIDDYAFANCISLESIVIPKSVEYIAYRAFKGCKNLKNVKIMNKNIILAREVFDK